MARYARSSDGNLFAPLSECAGKAVNETSFDTNLENDAHASTRSRRRFCAVPGHGGGRGKSPCEPLGTSMRETRSESLSTFRRVDANDDPFRVPQRVTRGGRRGNVCTTLDRKST